MAIVATDPSKRSTDNIITLINGYTIGNTEAEHLYDGSIIQSGGDTIYDGIVNFGSPSVQIQIIQDGAVLADDWWNFSGGGLNPNATAGMVYMIPGVTPNAAKDLNWRWQSGWSYGSYIISILRKQVNDLRTEFEKIKANLYG